MKHGCSRPRQLSLPRTILGVGIVILQSLFWVRAADARDPLPGDVRRIKTIGLTVANVDSEVEAVC
jgi:hypothetical protein